MNEYSYMKSAIPLVNTLAAMHVAAWQRVQKTLKLNQPNICGTDAAVSHVTMWYVNSTIGNDVFNYSVAMWQRASPTHSVWMGLYCA